MVESETSEGDDRRGKREGVYRGSQSDQHCRVGGRRSFRSRPQFSPSSCDRKAHEMNVPKENIARAIEKGKGVGADALVQVTYEAYGPHGVAMLIEAATDNKQRTVAVVKNAFHQAGLSLATPGAVTYLFTRCGILTVAKDLTSYDVVLGAALDAGADDVIETTDMFEIYCSIGKLSSVKQALVAANIAVDNTAIIMKAQVPVSLDDVKRDEIESFIEEIENLDDVQSVYTNLAG